MRVAGRHRMKTKAQLNAACFYNSNDIMYNYECLKKTKSAGDTLYLMNVHIEVLDRETVHRCFLIVV